MEANIAVEAPYTVNLCDFPGLPVNARMDAEIRYSKALERVLGNADAVAAAYAAWCYAAEGDSDVDPEDKAQAIRWVKAVDTARQAGFRGLSEDEGAYFEVRLG